MYIKDLRICHSQDFKKRPKRQGMAAENLPDEVVWIKGWTVKKMTNVVKSDD